jgi:Raf kinase inhibitor-like YbhB/YbcL family protein
MRIVHHSRHVRPILLIIGLIILGLALSVMLRETFSKNVPSVEVPAVTPTAAPFELGSPAFNDLGTIPARFTCAPKSKTLPLTIKNAPSNTKEFALIMRDTSTKPKDTAHWVVWGIPATTTVIVEGTLPQGAIQGLNDISGTYSPPCPTAGSGEHTYIFDLYALSDTVQLDLNTTKDSLAAAINGKVISKVQLAGKVTKPARQ